MNNKICEIDDEFLEKQLKYLEDDTARFNLKKTVDLYMAIIDTIYADEHTSEDSKTAAWYSTLAFGKLLKAYSELYLNKNKNEEN